jgi:hypothetical protein
VLLAIFTSASTSTLATSIHENDNNNCVQFSDLSPPTAKDTAGKEIDSTSAGQLVIIFSTFSNPCDYDQQIVIVTEARDQAGATAFFQETIVNASAFNSTEVSLLWWPENAGAYELRSFAISNSTEQILTNLQTRELLIFDYELVNNHDSGYNSLRAVTFS